MSRRVGPTATSPPVHTCLHRGITAVLPALQAALVSICEIRVDAYRDPTSLMHLVQHRLQTAHAGLVAIVGDMRLDTWLQVFLVLHREALRVEAAQMCISLQGNWTAYEDQVEARIRVWKDRAMQKCARRRCVCCVIGVTVAVPSVVRMGASPTPVSASVCVGVVDAGSGRPGGGERGRCFASRGDTGGMRVCLCAGMAHAQQQVLSRLQLAANPEGGEAIVLRPRSAPTPVASTGAVYHGSAVPQPSQQSPPQAGQPVPSPPSQPPAPAEGGWPFGGQGEARGSGAPSGGTTPRAQASPAPFGGTPGDGGGVVGGPGALTPSDLVPLAEVLQEHERFRVVALQTLQVSLGPVHAIVRGVPGRPPTNLWGILASVRP